MSRPRSLERLLLEDAICGIVAADRPVTIRNVYYRLVTAGHPKTDAFYNRVKRLGVNLRREGRIPYPDIVDASRAGLNHTGVSGPTDEAFAREVAALYRRDAWASEGLRPIVIVESRSIAGAVSETCSYHGADLWPLGGWPSESMLYNLASCFVGGDEWPIACYIGDYDPAGLAIRGHVRARVEAIAAQCWSVPLGGEDYGWHDVAVTAEQYHDARFIAARSPAKVAALRQHPYPYDATLEAEAIPAPELRALLSAVLDDLMPRHRLDALRLTERAERSTIRERIASGALEVPLFPSRASTGAPVRGERA